MTIQVTEIQRVFRYNGVALPDVPGMTPREVRDLYSAQYPELISAEIQTGEVVNGVQEYTFRKAVGTKGRTGREGERFAALKPSTLRFEFRRHGDRVGRIRGRRMAGRGGFGGIEPASARSWGGGTGCPHPPVPLGVRPSPSKGWGGCP